MAAPDDPLRVLANPAGAALVEGLRWGAALTARDGEGPAGEPLFVHAAALAEGSGGRGWALWGRHSGRQAAPGSGALGATELALAYSYGVSPSTHLSIGVGGEYRRVRTGPPVGGEVREDHYLSVGLGFLAAAGERVTLGARIDSLFEVRQQGPSGGAEDVTARPPALGAAVAYGANRYLVLEADVEDLLDAGPGRVLRAEARLYPVPTAALRLGFEQRDGDSGWLLGAAVEMPGGRWALSYAFTGGPGYGGMHQLGVVVAAMP